MQSKKDLRPFQDLEARALRHAAPLVLEANGWTGEVTILPYVIMRCDGMAAEGDITRGGETVPVSAMSIIRRHGRVIAEMEVGKGYPKTKLSCRVTMSVVVVTGPESAEAPCHAPDVDGSAIWDGGQS